MTNLFYPRSLLKSIIKYFSILFFFFHLGPLTFSQQISIHGEVWDGETKEPLAYASIFLLHHNVGTTTNNKGQFELTLSRDMIKDTLMVSYIGYGPETIPLSHINSKISITLKKGSTNLNEVVVTADSPLTLMKKAISNIPNNYDYSPYKLQGFYRVSTHNGRNYIGLSEAVFALYISKIKDPHFQFHLEKIRAIQDQKASENITIGMAPESVLSMDDVYNYKEGGILSEDHLAQHNFTFQGYELKDGRETYKISFEPKKGKGGFVGYLLVDTESLAFLYFNYGLNEKALSNYDFGSSLQRSVLRNFMGRTPSMSGYKNVASYRKIGDKYYLQLIQADRTFSLESLRGETTVNWDGHLDYVVTNIDTENVKPFSKSETLKKGTFLEHEKSDFDPNFWRDYTIIVPTIDFEKVQKRLEAKNKRYLKEEKSSFGKN